MRSQRLIAVAGLFSAALVLAVTGCTQSRQPAAAAPAPAAEAAAPEQKSWLVRSGDAARAVVATPVRWFTPTTKPPATQPAPVVYEAPDAIIVPRQPEGGPGMIMVPAAPPETPPTPPATGP